jgi:hypothetical protein
MWHASSCPSRFDRFLDRRRRGMCSIIAVAIAACAQFSGDGPQDGLEPQRFIELRDELRRTLLDGLTGNIKDDSREFTVGGSQLLNCSFVRRSLLGEDFLDSGYIVFQHGDPAVQFEAVGGVSRIINP